MQGYKRSQSLLGDSAIKQKLIAKQKSVGLGDNSFAGVRRGKTLKQVSDDDSDKDNTPKT